MKLESDLYYDGDLSCEKLIFLIPGTVLSPEIYKNVKIPDGYEAVYLSWHCAPGDHSIESTAEKIVSLLERYRCHNVILAGHSSSGFIVMQAYLTLKDKSIVKGMLLCDTGCNTTGHSNSKSPEEIKASWDENGLDAFLKKCFATQVDGETYEHLKEYGRKISAQVRIEPWVSQLRLDFTQRLGEISCPTAIVHGHQDKVRPIEHAQQLADGIRNAKLYVIEHSGHTPMYEAADEFSEVLAKLCQRAEGR